MNPYIELTLIYTSTEEEADGDDRAAGAVRGQEGEMVAASAEGVPGVSEGELGHEAEAAGPGAVAAEVAALA